MNSASVDLQSADQKLTDAIEALPVGFALFDADDCYVLWNRRYAEIYGPIADRIAVGVRFESVVRAALEKGLIVEAVGQEEEWLANRLAQFRQASGSYDHQLQGGTWIRVEERPTADGGRLGVLTDITARQRAEADRARAEIKLREQKFRIDAAVDNMAQGLVMFDADGRVVLWNERYVEMYGLSPGVVTEGCTFLELMTHRKERGLFTGDPEEFYQRNRPRLAEGKPWSNIHNLVDGRTIQTRQQPTPDGGWVSTHADITERREAEAKIREQKLQLDAAVDNMAQGLVMFDADETVVLWNERYIDMFGLSPSVVREGCSFLELLAHRKEVGVFPGDIEAHRQAHLARRTEGKPWSAVRDYPNGRSIRTFIRPLPGGGWVATQEDITERKETEVKLREKNLQLDAAVDNMAQGLAMFGADGRVALLNQRYIELYGMLPDIVREGCSYLDIMRHKKEIGIFLGDPETYCDGNRARIAEGESWTLILDLPEDRFIRVLIRPLGDGGWVSTHEDITESRRALTQLGEQKMQLDVAVENMTQGLVLFDPDERIALVNNRYIQMYKLSRDIVKVGCSILDLIKYRRGLGSIPGEADAFYRELLDRRAEGKSWNRIVELSDGRYIQVSHQPLANGGWVSTHEDITERREAERAIQEREERIRAIMDNAADGIITITDRGVIESLNQASETIFGYSEKEIRGRNVKVLMPEPDRGQHDGYIASYLKTGKGKIIDIGPREVSAQRKDGTIFPMSLAISVMDVGGEQKFIGITRDITKQKETELQLQQAQKMETIGQLTAGIAHDFNNLLTVIMGNLQLVTRSINDNDMALKRLDSTMSAAKSGAALISQLLSFSRQQVLETKILDLNEVVRDMEDMLRRSMGDDVVITTELDKEPCLGRTDRYQFEHVLLNLCVNARDAMPGGGYLTIKTGRRRLDEAYAAAHADLRPGNYVEVIVSDTGSGIPADIRDKIFEPFFSTKERGKGSGLGLSTVMGFMKQTDGHVDVESEVGHGATFRLFIPIAGFTSSAVIDRRSASSDPVADSHRGCVLVVEDEDSVREIAVSVLTEAGYNVVEANNGQSGLKAFNDHPGIDAVFTDVIMPGGMSGVEMIDTIRKMHPDIPVLFVSGYTERAQDERVASLDRSKFINKPYDISELPNHIASLLEEERD